MNASPWLWLAVALYVVWVLTACAGLLMGRRSPAATRRASGPGLGDEGLGGPCFRRRRCVLRRHRARDRRGAAPRPRGVLHLGAGPRRCARAGPPRRRAAPRRRGARAPRRHGLAARRRR